MTKTFFIIPGFQSQATEIEYQWLRTHLKKSGYKVVTVPVNWRYRTLSQNSIEFISFFNSHKSERNYILGFSYGAVIAFMTAEITKPTILYLCSLSPDFKEDEASMPMWIKQYIGIRRTNDLLTRSATELATNLSCKTVIFYGEEESKLYPALKKRAEETANLTKKAQLVVIKNAPHDISYPTYKDAIIKYI